MMKSDLSENAHFIEINGERVYVGPERRADRRNSYQSERVNILLQNFGLDRRVNQDRRQANSSWLLISEKEAVNQ